MKTFSKLVVSLALAAFVMGAAVPATDVSQAVIKHVPQLLYEKFFPDPIMGIRGNAIVQKLPMNA